MGSPDDVSGGSSADVVLTSDSPITVTTTGGVNCWSCSMVMGDLSSRWIAKTTIGDFVCCSPKCAGLQQERVEQEPSIFATPAGNFEFTPTLPINFIRIDAKIGCAVCRGLGTVTHFDGAVSLCECTKAPPSDLWASPGGSTWQKQADGSWKPLEAVEKATEKKELRLDGISAEIRKLSTMKHTYFDAPPLTTDHLSEIIRAMSLPCKDLKKILEPAEGERLAAFFARSEHEGQPAVRHARPEPQPSSSKPWWRCHVETGQAEKLRAAHNCEEDFAASLLQAFSTKRCDEQLAAMRDDFDNLEDA